METGRDKVSIDGWGGISMNLKLDAKWEEFAEAANTSKDGIIVFGGSSCADTFLNKIKEKFDVKYIIDNDEKKWGKRIFGKYEVYSADKLKETTAEDIILITSTYYEEIVEQCMKLEIQGSVYSYLHLRDKVVRNDEIEVMNKELPKLKEICADDRLREIIDRIAEKKRTGIKDYSDIYEENQYFVENIIEPDENEVFIDGGAFNGETVREVIKFEANKLKKIYSFEMDKINFEKIPKDEFDDRVIFLNYGLWDSEQKLSFVEGERSSEIADYGNSLAECIALDSFIKEKVTFIKMDIEGAEQRALKGAAEIIKKDKPKLAICLYHKLEDMWEIPFYIHELVPEYKIYIRHHGKNDEETVMYAHI